VGTGQRPLAEIARKRPGAAVRTRFCSNFLIPKGEFHPVFPQEPAGSTLQCFFSPLPALAVGSYSCMLAASGQSDQWFSRFTSRPLAGMATLPASNRMKAAGMALPVLISAAPGPGCAYALASNYGIWNRCKAKSGKQCPWKFVHGRRSLLAAWIWQCCSRVRHPGFCSNPRSSSVRMHAYSGGLWLLSLPRRHSVHFSPVFTGFSSLVPKIQGGTANGLWARGGSARCICAYSLRCRSHSPDSAGQSESDTQ